jgi:prolyl oligopeptidase
MKKTLPTIALVCMILSCKEENQLPTVSYPETKKVDTVDVYFGESVADPYRWLEDDLSDETAAWVKAQNEVTFGFLNQIPYRDQIRQRLEQVWNYERISAPFKEAGYTYFYKNDGLQNQSVLYRKDENGNEEVFLDPNTFSADGSTSLSGLSFSKDGFLVAYTASKAGSDWNSLHVMDAITKEKLEELDNIKFSGIAWKGNEGFYYSTYEKPKGSELSAKTDQHRLYYHKLGTPQSEDKVIFGNEIKRRYISGYTTEDGRFLVISAANSTSGNELYIKDLSDPKAVIKPIVDHFDNDSYIIDNRDNLLIIQTNRNAPNQKIVKVDVANPAPDNWVDVIPETEHVLSASTGGGYLFANYMKDAISMVKQYDFDGNLIREITLPGVGSAGGFSGKKDEKELYFNFTNYIMPSTIFSFNPADGSSAVYQKPKVDFNPDLYESKQVFYASKDGTQVPMIITYKKGTKLDGKNPTILYGYGGFNVSLTPSFSTANIVWLENGGVYAVANIRGGGEYGKKWHNDGTQMKKQNVFDDFIAAAEFLIKEKYTSSDYLAVRGGSNGGLLVGAVMTQRPELFRVALPAVGVLDMLRYHTFTAGAGWAYDYGTADDSKEMFQYLKVYSPLHNIKEGVNYPATLVTTGDHDDRVVPAHSFKFAATLQEKQAGPLPVLIRIDVNAGHGAGKPVSKTIDEQADIQAFTLFCMGIQSLGKK